MSAYESPSARRAWIEILRMRQSVRSFPVALRTEGVDRNFRQHQQRLALRWSPSARRAWIEIASAAVR